MKVYVKDAHANKQINTIAQYVEDGLSDSDISKRLSELGFKNLASSDGVWTDLAVKEIRESFSLDKTDRLVVQTAKSMPTEITQKVVVVDIKMPFFSMVEFMVKWVLASIPAFLLLLLFSIGAIFIIKAILA